MNMRIIVLLFVKREETITGQQGYQNIYQVKFVSYLDTFTFISKIFLKTTQAEGSLWSIHKRGNIPDYVNLESAIEVFGQVAQQGLTCYSSINYS